VPRCALNVFTCCSLFLLYSPFKILLWPTARAEETVPSHCLSYVENIFVRFPSTRPRYVVKAHAWRLNISAVKPSDSTGCLRLSAVSRPHHCSHVISQFAGLRERKTFDYTWRAVRYVFSANSRAVDLSPGGPLPRLSSQQPDHGSGFR